MIKLTFRQIRDPEFNPLLNRILRAQLPLRTAKRLLDLAKDIQAEQMKSDELWQNITDKFMEPANPDKPDGFLKLRSTLTEEEKTLAESQVKEFEAIPVEIQKQRITFDELADVRLSPAELMKLEGLIEGVEA